MGTDDQGADPGADADAGLRLLFEEHWTGLCRLAFLVLGDPAGAEECVQDAYLRVFRAWDRVRTMERPDLYLRTAVVNQCRSRLLRRQVEARAAGWPGRSSDEPERRVDERRDEILAAVRRLPPRQRAAVVLRYYEDRSEAEIARALDCSPGTVKSQLAKARAALGRTLAPYLEDDG